MTLIVKASIVSKAKQYVVNVTAEHIEKAREGTLYVDEMSSCCPIAIAVFESVTGGIASLGKRHYSNLTPLVTFATPQRQGIANPFTFAGDYVIWKGTDIPGQRRIHPPVRSMKVPKELSEFAASFDSGKPVEPFSFVYELPDYLGTDRE